MTPSRSYSVARAQLMPTACIAKAWEGDTHD
jgi:hypothetical protein